MSETNAPERSDEVAPTGPPPADVGPAEGGPAEAGPAEGTTSESPSGAEATEASPEAPESSEPGAEVSGADDAPKEGEKRPPRARQPRPKRKPRPPAPERRALTTDQALEAREAARRRVVEWLRADPEVLTAGLDLLESGKSIAYLARFRRDRLPGVDERRLRILEEEYVRALALETRRVELREILRERGALTPEAEEQIAKAREIPPMEDVAAPHLPVLASRATVARGMGLEPLADAIRSSAQETPLADLARPFVKEGGEPATLDDALGGARDILAEEICLDARLRGRLRELFRREATLTVAARTERRGEPTADASRYAALVGPQGPASKVPPLKFLTIRRGERERLITAAIEPPEEAALPIVHEHACAPEHPHGGFLRAAAEDGYRRILKPLLGGEIREALKEQADEQVLDQAERTLRNALLGPVGGPRRTLGIRADVIQGHRWCAVDPEGLPVASGSLPHEGTAGREACVTELRELLKTWEAAVVAVGSGAGRAEALSLAKEAAAAVESQPEVVVVSDAGIRAIEALGKVTFEDRADLPSEQRGAWSIARRFQDPLAELVRLDSKALAIAPHVGDVHGGRLRRMVDRAVQSCVAFAGVDAEKADVDLLARMPGFDRTRAKAFADWRKANGPLPTKTVLATVEGVGPEAAEQAVGFMRLPHATDPRDRTQLHPEQYAIAEKMAEQVGIDLPGLFSNPRARAAVNLRALETPEWPMAVLKYVLYQATAGSADPRPRHAKPIPPPPGLTLETLKPGLVLEGRVLRSMPFGVFVDVGLGVQALVPMAHLGDRPGADPAAVAPVGAVIQARVMEVDPAKKRLTLTMRREDRDFAFRGPRGPGRGPGPEAPRGEGRPPVGRGRRPERGRDGPRDGDRARRPEPRRRPEPEPVREPSAEEAKPAAEAAKPAAKGGGPKRKAGKFQVQEIGLFDRHRFRDEPGTPRHISLKPETPKPDEAPEEALTPEQLLAKKLAELQQKLGGR